MEQKNIYFVKINGLMPLTISSSRQLKTQQVGVENVLCVLKYVRVVRLVVIRNVFGTCPDKMDADHGMAIINFMLESP